MGNTDHLDPAYVAHALELARTATENSKGGPRFDRHANERYQTLLNTASGLGYEAMSMLTQLQNLMRLEQEAQRSRPGEDICLLPDWVKQEAVRLRTLYAAKTRQARTQPPP